MGEHMNALVMASPGGQERAIGSLLEAMGQVAAKTTWPMESMSQSPVPVQVMSHSISLFLWDILAWVWYGPGAF